MSWEETAKRQSVLQKQIFTKSYEVSNACLSVYDPLLLDSQEIVFDLLVCYVDAEEVFKLSVPAISQRWNTG